MANPVRGNISLLLLVAVNLLPVAGVLLWGWSVFEIVALYWFENVVIGGINVLKMLTAAGEPPTNTNAGLPEVGGRMVQHGAKVFLIPFFTVHYGMFCFVHGIFVFTLLGGKGGGGLVSSGPVAGMRGMISEIFGSGGKWFVMGIIGSHLFSFFSNYIGKGEFRRISAAVLMASPYGRIVVLHIAIILGAFVITALGSPVLLLLLLIAGKIALDAKLHLRSHRKFRGAPAET